jgi:DNA primase
MRDRELVQRIKDATDLVALVGQAVKLRKQGAAWVGLCPFHSERSPSFQVLADRGFYHCFGCGKHGDAFTWVMEREGLTFPEAMEQLARAAGIELPKVRERSAAEVDLETKLRTALEAAQAFYEKKLQETAKASNYLKGRGISESFLAEAGFGFAPDSWESLVNHLRSQGFSAELIEQTGLASRSERGSLIDFLRNRITIPIHDARGRLIAFGGRAFGDDKPKYLNTRETALFNKGQILFGFHRAKGQLRDGALVVEGYFDVLQLHQEGIHAAVAPLGTALTEGHLQQVGRFTKRLVLCFDGDAAGQRAMEKGLRLSLPMGFEVRLLVLPPGEDPDTWCLKVGAAGFKEIVASAPSWVDYVRLKIVEGRNLNKTNERMEAFREFLEHFVYLPKSPENWSLLSSIAHGLSIPNSEINRALKEFESHRHAAKEPEVANAGCKVVQVDDLLKPLLRLCRDGEIRARLAEVPPAWWESLTGAPLLQAVLDADGADDHIPGEALAQLRYLEAIWATKDDAECVPSTVFLKLEIAYVEREIQAVNRQMQDPAIKADPDSLRRLEVRASELLGRARHLTREKNNLTRRMF